MGIPMAVKMFGQKLGDVWTAGVVVWAIFGRTSHLGFQAFLFSVRKMCEISKEAGPGIWSVPDVVLLSPNIYTEGANSWALKWGRTWKTRSEASEPPHTSGSILLGSTHLVHNTHHQGVEPLQALETALLMRGLASLIKRCAT